MEQGLEATIGREHRNDMKANEELHRLADDMKDGIDRSMATTTDGYSMIPATTCITDGEYTPEELAILEGFKYLATAVASLNRTMRVATYVNSRNVRCVGSFLIK